MYGDDLLWPDGKAVMRRFWPRRNLTSHQIGDSSAAVRQQDCDRGSPGQAKAFNHAQLDVIALAAQSFDDDIVRSFKERMRRCCRSPTNHDRLAVIFPSHVRDTCLVPGRLMGNNRIGQYVPSFAAEPGIVVAGIFVLRIEEINDGRSVIEFATTQASVKDGKTTASAQGVINPSDCRNDSLCPT